MNFNWQLPSNSDSDLIDQIKSSRDYPDQFYQHSWDTIPDFGLLKDVQKAVERILKAVENKENIIIFGHDDLDGITSTYILYDFLETIGSQNHYYYIPNRFLENHGIQAGFIRKTIDLNCSLVITVDGGISSYESVTKLNDSGCDVIITDHHLVPNYLPPAFAIVNPKQKDCAYPYKMLAGVGVTYGLIDQICRSLSQDVKPNYLFWTAVGSIADKVPMTGINRTIVKEAIQNWSVSKDSTIQLFEKRYWKGDQLHSKLALIRQIIKIFNNGRLADGENSSLQTLIELPQDKDKLLSSLIEKQVSQEDKLNESLQLIRKKFTKETCCYWIYLDEKDEISYEFLGFCASILAKEYMIPIVLLKERDGKILCEARCTEGFNLVDAFRYSKRFLTQFGGHKKAAGFVTKPEMINGFTNIFKKYVHLHENEILNHRKLSIDAVLDFDNENERIALLNHDLSFLEPFGEENPEPLILIKNFLWERDHSFLNLKNISFHKDQKTNIVISHSGNYCYLIDWKEDEQK